MALGKDISKRGSFFPVGLGFFFFFAGGDLSSLGCAACSLRHTITRLRAGAGMQRIKLNVNPFSAVI